MNPHHSAWATLGIEPTGDTRAIRTAYARLLKTLDADADPQAVIALRDARDMAMHFAQHETAEPSDPAAPAERIETGPEWQERPDAEAHAGRLQAMLHAERDPATPFATPAEREAMLAHWRVVTADPRLEEIGFFAQFEQWATGLIAYNTPLSDPLIIPATELFGWTASDDTIAQSREVAHISHRYGWLRFLDDMQQPGHQQYDVWEELSKPPEPHPTRGRIGPARVTGLLEVIREFRPDLENRLDPARVALWDRMRPEPVPGHGLPAREPPPSYHVPPPRQGIHPGLYIGIAVTVIIGIGQFMGSIPVLKGPPEPTPYEQVEPSPRGYMCRHRRRKPRVTISAASRRARLPPLCRR